MNVPSQLLSQIKQDEGFRAEAYLDTLNNWTIGYGHTPAQEGDTITEEDAIQLLMQDLAEAERNLTSALPWVSDLDPIRYSVLWNMCFNEGIGHLLEFKHMLAACQQGDWEEAANQMANSLWAQQVKSRAIQLEHQMRFGVWTMDA